VKCQPALYDRKGQRICRETMPSCIPPAMKEWVRAQMAEYNMSGSWVVAVALSYASGIDIDMPAELKARKRRRAA
jgi:hypothetical protein